MAICRRFFVAIRIAIGMPVKMPSTVTMAPKPYESNRLCQKLPQILCPVNACTRVFPVAMAWNAGNATKSDGIKTIIKKTAKAMPFRVQAVFL